MTCAKVVAGIAVMALLGGIVYTQEPVQEKRPKTEPPSAAAKPATYKVEKKPFKIELSVKGILEAEYTAEISYRPHLTVHPPASQGPLTIRKIVEQGATVKKGDLLVTFDTKKIDEVIDDLEKERKVLDASIKLAEEEQPLLEKSVPAEIAAAETAKKRADEDLKYFLEVGRPQAEKQIEMYVKMEKFGLEYSQEELRQLEKMYKANDLTEETEKMILRRQQNAVETASFWYQAALVERDHMLKSILPNREVLLKENQIKQELSLEKARKTLGLMATQRQVALVKMRLDRDKAAGRLEKILKDRTAMSVHSPIEGIVYHGKFHKGRWTASDSLDGKLIPNGTVYPDEVFLTVVKPRPIIVHLAIDEKDVHLLKPGLQGTAKALVNPDRKLTAQVTKLSSLPTTPGKFEAVVVLGVEAADANLMPGMACSVKFVPYSNKDALTVPTKTIHEEDDKFVVYLPGKDGKHDKREVTPGRADAEHTEIRAGLQEGDEVLLDRPGPKTSEKNQVPEKDKAKKIGAAQ
jgi:HlyD family secretion protein